MRALLHAVPNDSPAPFLVQPLPAPDEALRRVALDSLVRFLRNPARHLCRERLRLRLELDDAELDDDEPFTIERGEDWQLREQILAWALAGKSAAAITDLAVLRPEVPHGAIGRIETQPIIDTAIEFATRHARARRAAPLDALAIELPVGEFIVEGALAEMHPAGMLLWRFGGSSVNARIEAWVRHLALNTAAPAGIAPRTQWLATDGGFFFEPAQRPAETLHSLLKLYWRGLMQPAHFFPRAAFAYMSGDDERIERARKVWGPSTDEHWTESSDDYYQLVFRGQIERVLDSEFESLAQAVVGPLLAACTDGIHAEFA